MALPGIAAVIADGRLRISPELSGNKVTILGTSTATGLTLLEPYSVTNGKLAIAALEHVSGDPSELSLAVEECLMSGCQNLEVVQIARTSGELAAFTANSRWDALLGAYSALRAHEVEIVHPAATYIDETGLTGTDADSGTRDNFAKQLADFCHRSTVGDANTCIGVIGTKPINFIAAAESWTDAYSDTGDLLFEIPSRAHLNEWVYHLTGSASGEDHSAEVLTSSGFLAGSDEESTGIVSISYDFWARDDAETIDTDQFGTKVDGGGYISVVAGACRRAGPSVTKLAAKYGETSFVTMNTNAAAAYAGFISTLATMDGTTNKSIPGIFRARELTRAQAVSILDDRFVTFLTRPKGYVVVKGVTGAYNASDFTRSDFVMLSTRRITNACLDLVARAAEPFIGLPNNEVHRNAMTSAVDTALNRYLKEGGIQRYSFKLESTPDMQVLGNVNIYLTIVPAFEITNITVYITLARE